MKKALIWAAFSAALGALAAPFAAPILGFIFLRQPIGPLPKFDGWEGAARDMLAYYGGLIDGANPWDAFACSMTAAAFAVALIMLWIWSKNPDRNVKNGVLGDARIIDAERERRSKNDFWDGRGAPTAAGLVLGASKRGYLYDSGVPHALVVGKTGSGTSQFGVLETRHLLMASAWNIVATGKSELVEFTAERAEAEGYEVAVLDLNGYPGASGFNPLDLVASYAEWGDAGAAQQTARQTAADLIPLSGEANAYFPKAARSALSAVMLLVAFSDAPREAKNMPSVCEIIARGTTAEGKDPSAPLKEYIRNLGPSHPAYAPAADFLSDGGVTVAGKNVLSTLKEAVGIFADEGVRRVAAQSDISLADLMARKTIVYVHLLEEDHPYMGLFRAFFSQYWRVAQQTAAENGGRLPRETAIVGDEWGNLGKVDCMGELVTLGRSMHLHLYALVQNLKQLNKYDSPGDNGAGRDKLLGSMGTKVALSLGSIEDCEYFSRLCGKRTLRTQGTSEQRGGGMAGRVGSGTSYNETSDFVIHEWEWLNRVPARDGSIVVKGGENGKPGREGVFRMPLAVASATPAGQWFGLGDEEANGRKRTAFRRKMEARGGVGTRDVRTWCPDYETASREEPARIEADEFSAWDEGL